MRKKQRYVAQIVRYTIRKETVQFEASSPRRYFAELVEGEEIGVSVSTSPGSPVLPI